MTSLFRNKKTFIAVAFGFVAAVAVTPGAGRELGAFRGGATLVMPAQVATGPTIPPGPTDDRFPAQVATGPTIPPGPTDDRFPAQVATGPTIPPGPTDDRFPAQVATGPTIPPGPTDDRFPAQVATGPTIPPGPTDDRFPVVQRLASREDHAITLTPIC